MPPLVETARAKVNLTLRVHGRREDGYHDLESLVAFADCADTLTLEPGKELKLTTGGPGARDCGDGDDNLVVRVSRALKERRPEIALGHFTLEKHLPVAAGIGGGSADAAAALRLLARANGIDLSDKVLSEVARQTGADIPVCLPSRPCTMTGVGEQLTFVTIPKLPCVMVNPRVGVATKDVFVALGLRHGELLAGPVDVISSTDWPGADGGLDEWLRAISEGTNDLETPAIKVEPIVGEVLAALRATSGIGLARMSGSGATCFGIFHTIGDAKLAAAEIKQKQPGWWIHAGTLS